MDNEEKRTIAMKGYNPQYGARPILGIIRKELRNPLSKLIISGEIKAGDTVQVSIQDDNTVFKTTYK
jgi:ATP-dependent Clp protease ATP-binding subunit ClpA